MNPAHRFTVAVLTLTLRLTGTASAQTTTPTPAGATAGAVTVVGARAVAFRPGARPPRSAFVRAGQPGWEVVLAASSDASPAMRTLFEDATHRLHLAATWGDLSCIEPVSGAYPDAMPAGERAQMVAIEFRAEADARRFAASLATPALWVGRVRVRCAD